MQISAPITTGPRYTISGDFHYCVIEATSSELGETTIAVALSDSPGAQPGEEWRERHQPFLWLIPVETSQCDPLTLALRLLHNWYRPTEAVCLTCGECECRGCYPEMEPIKAQAAEVRMMRTSNGTSCLACWNPIHTCSSCGEFARCACGCNNVLCADARR
jgi:hypothetical protein